MTNNEMQEWLGGVEDYLHSEAAWWKDCALSDRSNRDIGLFAKGIEIGFRRSAKLLNERAKEIYGGGHCNSGTQP